ncbi:MAG: DUF4097 domain-containing protein [Candidatus Babeliales bacterium]
MHITHKHYIGCVLALALISTSCYAISLSSVSSWFSTWQEETFFQEATIGLNATLELTNISGPITIKTWSVPKIVIEATKSAKEKDLATISIVTDINEQHARITTVYHEKGINGSVSYELMIPELTNVTLHTDEGTIKLKKVHGTISVRTNSGNIDIEDATRSLDAHAAYGNITASYSHVPLNSHLQVTTENGNITLALPKQTHARVIAKTHKGTITSEQSVTIAPQTVKLDRNYWKRVRTELTGLLGNGGAHIELTAQYGNIQIVEH